MFTLRSSSRFIGACLLVMALLVGTAAPQTAHAATLTVNTLLDENDGSCTDGDCSLRDAIQVAAAGDTITFSVTGTIILTLGQLNIDKDLTISGPGVESLTVSGNNSSRVFFVAGRNVVFLGLTIAGGSAEDGGGIHNFSGNAMLMNITFSGNSADWGGGGMVNYYGTATLADVTFSNNSAYDGGGIRNDGSSITLTNVTFNSNTANYDNGGGMYNWNGTATLMNVTFNGNSALGGSGGGMFDGDGATATLTNVTFSNNSADYGGGMSNHGTFTLTNVTASGNSANFGGGIYIAGDSQLNLKNALLAGNTAPSGPDCSGPLISYGYNLIQDTTGCTITGDETGNIYGEDPLLGPLQDNGGDTLTHALLPGSPAIDAADFTDPYGNPVTEDQRGVARPQGPANDIGAYEAEVVLDTMHVQDITLRQRGTRLVAMVTVYDQASLPVEGANVTIEVSGPIPPRSLTRPTDVNGRVRFAGPARSGTWQLCVTDILKDGYTYDPTQNVETCDTITIP